MGGGCCDFCCVMDNPVGDFFRDIFCSDSGCSYHPSRSDTDAHARTIANELAEMKEYMAETNKKEEEKLINIINSSMDKFISELEKINNRKFSGKSLNINIEGIKKKKNDLSKNVIGHIGRFMDERLVLTDKELSIILEEHDDKKRGKNFDEFCTKLKKEAINSLKKKVKETVEEQQKMVRREIQIRLQEVDRESKEVLSEYNKLSELKKKEDKAIEKEQIVYMYKHEICDIILDKIEG